MAKSWRNSERRKGTGNIRLREKDRGRGFYHGWVYTFLQPVTVAVTGMGPKLSAFVQLNIRTM